ncbi:Membrane spanning protein [Chryseobacterium sp. IT-36CA2]
MKEFFLKGRKYKFFLGFHLFIVGLYSIYIINTLNSYNSSSYSTYYKESIFENIAKYSFYIVINLISGLIIYFKIKFTKVILNFFAVMIFILVCYAEYTLTKTYVNNSYYNFVITFNTGVIGFIIFYIFYLNKINEKEDIEINEIESIGKHKD